MRRLSIILAGLILAGPWSAGESETAWPGKSRAIIIVGLPGDAEHEKLFADTAGKWRDSLTNSIDFEVTVLFGRSGQQPGSQTPVWEREFKTPATRESIEGAVGDLKKSLQADDRLWVLFLGHGDYDGERASFHLPGRDFHADDLGKLFGGIKCKEQVFWLANSASGRFVKSLSAKGRIVIAATAADEESNETEFPHAFATVLGKLDLKKDGKVSVLDLYRRTVAEVETRFAADKRVPTEHAQLDDNGDGVGTEEPVVEKEGDKKRTADGQLAARTFLPVRKAKK